MDLKLIDAKGQAASTMAASDALFGRDYNEPLIHQVVTRPARTRISRRS